MEPPRPPRDMQGLLRFAIEGSDPNGPDTDDAGGVVMTEDRRRWLEDALQGLSVNIVEELGKALRVLDPERVLCTEEEPEEMENALEVIIDYVDSIDTARGEPSRGPRPPGSSRRPDLWSTPSVSPEPR